MTHSAIAYYNICTATQMKTILQMPWGILQKKVTDFNSTFSSVVIPKYSLNTLLYASHNSLDHVGATILYNLLKRLYYFQGMWKKIH